MHWEKCWIVLGTDAQGRALMAGPVKSSKAARELAAEKVRSDPQWRRAFPLEAPFGYDFHLSPDAPGEKATEAVRAKSFPDVPQMVGGPERAAETDEEALRRVHREEAESDEAPKGGRRPRA